MSATPERTPQARREQRIGWGIVATAVAVYLLQAAPMARELPFWNEQAATVPGPVFLEVDISRIDEVGPIPTRASCDARWFVYSTQRPNLRLCTTDLRGEPFGWPILVSPYASGIAIWPLGVVPWAIGPSYVLMRHLGLGFAILSLIVLFDIVARLSGVRRAAATVAMAAVSSPLILATSLGAYFETVPPLLALLGLAVLVRAGPHPPGGGRSAAAGLLFGLSVAANLKMVVVFGTITGLALLFRSPILRIGRGSLACGTAGAAVGFGPVLLALVIDPFGEVFRTADRYFGIVLERLSPAHLGAELQNILFFAVDPHFYLELAAGGDPRPPSLLLLGVAAVAFLWSLRAIWSVARDRPADVTVASAAGILLVYLVFVALVYNQIPPNYTPVLLAFPPLLAIAFFELGERARRLVPAPWANAAHVAVVAAGILIFGIGANLRSHDWMHGFPSVNIRAEESIVATLRKLDASEDVQLVTLLYSQSGVFDALGATARPSIALHPELHACSREPDRQACQERILARLLCPPGRLPLWFITTFGAETGMDADHPAEIRAALERAAAEFGLLYVIESRAPAPSGTGGIELVRIADAPARRACPADSRTTP